MAVLTSQLDTLDRLQPMRIAGTIATVRGMSVLVSDLPLPIGSLVRIENKKGSRDQGIGGSSVARGSTSLDPSHLGEVVGFDGDRAVVMLFGPSHGLAPGHRIIGEQSAQTVHVGRSLLGRLINGLGQPIDGRALSTDLVPRPLDPPPTSALQRRRINQPLPTGIAAIDAMTTIGKGQRMGVFSGPGVGKSTLVASIARTTTPEVKLIALIG
jgi:flagellum-specific ATP synthase